MMLSSSSAAKRRKKLYLKSYLEELAELAGRTVQAEELGSVEHAASIRDAVNRNFVQAAASSKVLFSDRSSEQFRQYVEKLHDANPSTVYIWSPRTIDCGALLVPSLCSVSFNFEFTVNDDGVMVFLSSDLVDKLLLDFFTQTNGEQRLKIETQGANWGKVIF